MRLKPTQIWAVINPHGELVRASKNRSDLKDFMSDYFEWKNGDPTKVGSDRVARVKITEVK
jgi:hypothetical protein